jgi:hypothetical protein
MFWTYRFAKWQLFLGQTPFSLDCVSTGRFSSPLDDSYQKAAAGVVEHQHRITCVGMDPAYCEVEQLGSSTVDRTGFCPTNQRPECNAIDKGKTE